MSAHPVSAANNRRVTNGLPFVEGLARRMASSMPYSIDIGDLIQDGMVGLIDAAHRFDESRGIKFETFAERRVRGAMIDALRRDAWPRGVRRQRRELEEARATLRIELGHEPSMADLAARVGSDETRVRRAIVRINTIEATAPLLAGVRVDETSLPHGMVPSQPDSPHQSYEKHETRQRLRQAMTSLCARDQKLISLYYYGELTMKDIGIEIGVNESRVSQLHARAIRHLRAALDQVAASRDRRGPATALAANPPALAKVASVRQPAPVPTPHAAIAAVGPNRRAKIAIPAPSSLVRNWDHRNRKEA
jgi:RNA polymerase sigma factor for flagellar operon FliA